MTEQTRKPNVFVTMEMPKLDYLPAEKYGDVVFLARDDLSPVSSSLNNDSIMRAIISKLTAFKPDEDYFIFSGSPILAAAVFAQVGKVTDAFRMLRWSNRDNMYTPIHIKLK